jgi:DNA-binding GntR family transcriptional regulator
MNKIPMVSAIPNISERQGLGGGTVAITAEDEAYRHLLSAIRSGRVGPGQRLIAEEIAQQVGVSRMPVREALRRLASEGLVMIRPNRGCVVSALTLPEIFEIFEIRSVLEGLAVRLAVPAVDSEDLAYLDRVLERMRANEDGDTESWLHDHSAFHDTLCRLSGRPKLLQQIRTLHVLIEPYLRVYRHHVVKPRTAYQAHRTLFAVIREKDPEAAEAAMRQHIVGTAPMLAEFLAKSQPHLVRNDRGRAAPRHAGLLSR